MFGGIGYSLFFVLGYGGGVFFLVCVGIGVVLCCCLFGGVVYEIIDLILFLKVVVELGCGIRLYGVR